VLHQLEGLRFVPDKRTTCSADARTKIDLTIEQVLTPFPVAFNENLIKSMESPVFSISLIKAPKTMGINVFVDPNDPYIIRKEAIAEAVRSESIVSLSFEVDQPEEQQPWYYHKSFVQSDDQEISHERAAYSDFPFLLPPFSQIIPGFIKPYPQYSSVMCKVDPALIGHPVIIARRDQMPHFQPHLQELESSIKNILNKFMDDPGAKKIDTFSHGEQFR
jgi:hypothetical protein